MQVLADARVHGVDARKPSAHARQSAAPLWQLIVDLAHTWLVTDPGDYLPRVGDELWFGLVGPIRVGAENEEPSEGALAWREAGRIARAAHSLEDLAALVGTHNDYRVRCEAIPRLRARFPDDPLTLQMLGDASTHPHAYVRDCAVMALGDIADEAAADLIAARLSDDDFDVRLSAAQELQWRDDPRAPEDAEAWALEGFLRE